MNQVGWIELFLNFLIHKISLVITVLFTILLLHTPFGLEVSQSFHSHGLPLNFSSFSPAFAAFEDEYLFAEDQKSIPLLAGKSNKSFKISLKKEPLAKVGVIQSQAVSSAQYMGSFDGGSAVQATPSKRILKSQKKNIRKTQSSVDLIMDGEELKFGSLVAMVDPQWEKPAFTLQTIQKKARRAPTRQKPTPSPVPVPTPEFHAKSFDSYQVKGDIRLREGLAFLGSMEVSWVVGDYEMAVGSINGPDATYEIEVKQLIGDVIISLYDSQDELIGEGILDLTQAAVKDGVIESRLEIFPIDWDEAGTIVDNYSLGSGVYKPVEGVEVALYAFNEAAVTDKQGQFKFYNWKKTNSRTLAIASKSGYRDSVFLLDSKKSAQVVLFQEKYVDAFFSYLDELGLADVEGRGTVFGRLHGSLALSGYSVRIEKQKPIYFQDSGLASIHQENSSQNGLFAFVGLDDGDYELVVEKDGEVVDHRVVAVEQGKISPVLVDLRYVKKHLEFFDPMMPDSKLSSVEVSFFDGVKTHHLSGENRTLTTLHGGHDPAIMDFPASTEITRTFVSRNKGLQRVPFLQSSKVLDLADNFGLAIENGLVVGFVKTKEKYEVLRMEGPAEKIVYFNEDGLSIDPEDEIPYGFMISGFEAGLSSITILRRSDGMALATDLVFSDHQSVSVTHIDILSP